jgi:hypothetical protein
LFGLGRLMMNLVQQEEVITTRYGSATTSML